jgi:hypothetical protein
MLYFFKSSLEKGKAFIVNPRKNKIIKTNLL